MVADMLWRSAITGASPQCLETRPEMRKPRRHQPDWQKSQSHRSAQRQMKRPNIDLPARARDEMVANQFLTDFGPEVAEQLQSISAQDLLRPDREIKDLRELLWSSIDNVESRDLDQLEYAEPVGEGQWPIMVAIADEIGIAHV